ncbi:MAG: ChaN family lipoprotein [Burkholderiales bacterium]|nr:ChaN family lipoprotein [Burkholderiales bacterium]
MMSARLLSLLLVTLLPACTSQASVQPCAQPGTWLAHDGEQVRAQPLQGLLAVLARQQVVLLGETHDSAEDHRWQLATLAQLHALRPDLAIGFEMFPRRLQPVLDRWVAGELSEAEFLRLTEWERVWGYDARLYLPLFHYARMNRLPMLALNVERSLIATVEAQGWEGVPEQRREGVSRPAPPSTGYLVQLREVFAHHPQKRGERQETAFARFVEAQTTWDRAMAQAIADYLAHRPQALVVGIVGAGHVRHGHGIAHQLKDLGVTRVANLLTWDARVPCSEYAVGLAQAVYVVQAPQDDPPRLGVAMEPAGAGVRIAQVNAGSVAEAAGLRPGDVITEAAGRSVHTPQDVRTTVQRLPPGTWLPLRVQRDGVALELIARFPPAP